MHGLLEALSDKYMFPLLPAYLMTIATTVVFDVDVKTVIAVITLVLAQLWMGIKWGMKIESTQTKLTTRLDNIDLVLAKQDKMLEKSEKFDELESIIHKSIKVSIEEVLRVQSKHTSHNAIETTGGV